MVTFSHSWPPIAACALVLLLVILWLLRRLIRPRVTFPPLLWLLEVRRASSPFQRLRLHVELAVAAASLLLLGLLFGRPILGGGPAAGRAVAIVLDCSLSMSAGHPTPIFERAKRHAAEILRALGPASRANLALAGVTVDWAYDEAPLGRDLGPVWRHLEGAAVTFGTGRLGDAVREAVERLDRSGPVPRVLHVISDFQEASFRDVPAGPFPGIRVVPVHVGAPSGANLALGWADRPAFVSFPGETVDLRLVISNTGDVLARGELSWRVAGRALDRTTVTVPARGETALGRNVSFASAGMYEGTVSIAADDTMDGDNTAHFAIRVLTGARAGISGPEPAVTTLIATALGGAGAPFTCEVLHSTAPAAPYDVIVAAGTPPGGLERATEHGTPVVLFLGPQADVPPWLALDLPPEAGVFDLAAAFLGHSQRSLGATRALRVAGRRAGPGRGTVLLRFADGAPAAVLLPERAAAVCLFDLTAEEDGLLGHAPAAVTLLGELARTVLSVRQGALAVGEARDVLLDQGNYRFFSPAPAGDGGGPEFFPSSRALGARTVVSFPAFTVPGFAAVWQNGRRVRSLPVAPPSGESQAGVAAGLLARWQDPEARGGAPRRHEATGLVLAILIALHLAWFMLSMARSSHAAPRV
jgi:hypothetical protein